METLKLMFLRFGGNPEAGLYPFILNIWKPEYIQLFMYINKHIFISYNIYLCFRNIFTLFSEIVQIRILFILCIIFSFLSFKSYMFSIIIPLTKELLRRTKMFLICNLRPNLKNLSRWLVPLKIVSNLRFNPDLNLNRVLADLSRGSNSLNSASCNRPDKFDFFILAHKIKSRGAVRSQISTCKVS